MLNRIIRCLLLIPFCMLNISASSLSPIIVKGIINLTDINEDIQLYLSVEEGLLNEVILLDLYVNDEEIYYKKEYVASYLDNQPIILDGFKENNEIKNIRINIGYREMIVEDSYISFDICAPTYQEYIMPIQNQSYYQNENPTKITFYMNYNNPKIFYEYESVSFIGKTINKLNNKRVLNLDDYYFKVNSNIPYELDFIELRLYCKLNHSDLYYIDDLYTIVEVPIYMQSTGHYKLENDYLYYVNEVNGGIYLNPSDNTNKDLMPFFIPLDYQQENIEYELVLYDIGQNHSTYIYKGLININKYDNRFSYSLIEDILYDVTYE